jgi:hypothetical protein
VIPIRSQTKGQRTLERFKTLHTYFKVLVWAAACVVITIRLTEFYLPKIEHLAALVSNYF